MNIGSGPNGELEFLDVLSILSFMISCNNISAEDIARSAHEINEEGDKRIERVLEEIHGHLSVQDSKLNIIMQQLEELKDGSKRDI